MAEIHNSDKFRVNVWDTCITPEWYEKLKDQLEKYQKMVKWAEHSIANYERGKHYYIFDKENHATIYGEGEVPEKYLV